MRLPELAKDFGKDRKLQHPFSFLRVKENLVLRGEIDKKFLGKLERE